MDDNNQNNNVINQSNNVPTSQPTPGPINLSSPPDSDINNLPTQDKNTLPAQANGAVPPKEPLGTASLVLGIVSLVLSFLIDIWILPASITGLVLGIINKAKKGKKFSGIILNSISIVFSLIGLLHSLGYTSNTFINMLRNTTTNLLSDTAVAGNYDCTGTSSNSDTYLITLNLNKDNSFLYGPYGHLSDNYAKGTYTVEKKQKENADPNYNYYSLTMTAPKESYIIDGKPSDHDFSSEAEFAITEEDGKKVGGIIFLSNYKMYFCYEK